MDDEMRDLFESIIIPGKPVYTLAGCIDASRAEEYEDLDDEFEDSGEEDADSDDEDDEDDEDDDDEDDDWSPEAIPERFRKILYYCDEKKLAFIRLAVELSEARAAWEKDVNYYPFWLYHIFGFVYLFEDDVKVFLVLPDELAAVYREVIAEEGFEPVNTKNRELIMYSISLIELYGAYEMEQFAAVWNHHHKDKITSEEAAEFHENYEEYGADYYLDENYAVNECLDDDDFDVLLDQTYDLEYYMPPKSVIREYYAIRYNYDYKYPGEKEMDDFLAAYISDKQELEFIQTEADYLAKWLQSTEAICEMLEDAGAPLDDAVFVSKFEELFNAMRNNRRLWELRGYMIYQFQRETSQIVPSFRLLEE